jgi:hypothetical protein
LNSVRKKEEILNNSKMFKNIFKKGSTSTNISPTDDNDKFDYLLCNCCLEILDDPITLMCGHNFCSVCLANWFLSSKKNNCMVCRTEWFGFPKVNLTLKKTIENLRNTTNDSTTAKNKKIKKNEKETNVSKESKDKLMKDFEKECQKLKEKSTNSNVSPLNNTNERRRQPSSLRFEIERKFKSILCGFCTGLMICIFTIAFSVTVALIMK